MEKCSVHENRCFDHVDLSEIKGVFDTPFVGCDPVVRALENPERLQGAVTHGCPVFHDFPVHVFRVGQAGTVVVFPVLVRNCITGLIVSIGQFFLEVG